MRKMLLLLLVASAAIADDKLLGPADYLKVLTASKLTYSIGSEPAKDPDPGFTCGQRDESMRVVSSGAATKKLVAWSVNPEAKKLIDDAEPLFQQKKYDEAAEKYRAAVALDAEAVDAYFFLGDTFLLGKHDPAAALEQYRKGIALDPTLPTGHLFASTALLQLGQTAEAREEVVQALVARPKYPTLWTNLLTAPAKYGIRPLTEHPFEPPAGLLGKKNRKGVQIMLDKSGQWLGYAICKAVWANEPDFRKQRGVAQGEWSLDEERACVANELMAQFNSAQNRLEDEQKKKGVAVPNVSTADIVGAMPALGRHLWNVGEAKMLDGYIEFEIVGPRCGLSISMLPAEARAALEAYVRKFVVVAADSH